MLSDEEKKAIDYFRNKICDFELFYGKKITTQENEYLKILLNLIEKQSKEIEELTLKNEKLYEDNLTLAQEIKEFIEGTNDVKYYSTSFIKNHYISKDKIKAKTKEWQKEKEFYNKDEDREWGQYNNWDWVDTIINEMQSLLEKE